MASEQVTTTKAPISDKALAKLLAQAQKGDTAALARAKEALRERPEAWGQMSKIGEIIEDAVIGQMCGENELAREVVRREMRAKRLELEGSNPSAIERLLAEQAVRSWVHLRHVELVQANNSRERSIAQLDQLERWVARAERRYLRVLSTLARVRRLPAPAVQIVDARQVHLTEGADVAQRATIKAPPHRVG